MKTTLNVLAAAAAATLCIASAHGQVSLTGTTFSENFDGLPSTGTTTLTADPQIGVIQDLPGTDFVGTEVAGTGTFTFVASDGSSNSGALFSLGATDSTERSLGTLASGSTTPAFGVQIINNTGSTIDSLALAGFAEQFRSSSTTLNVINAEFFVGTGTGDVTSANFLTAAGFTALDSFDLVGGAPVATVGAITPTSTAIAATIADDIAPGSSLFLRFVDFNDPGNDAAIGLDDFSLTATLAGAPVPEPTSLAVLGLGGLALVGRRRRA